MGGVIYAGLGRELAQVYREQGMAEAGPVSPEGWWVR